jgi:CheY-like chemotaxis protein
MAGGFRSAGCFHNIEALEKFQEQPFDLVVTDRAMPLMNGDQ